ncbi:MAG: hypothetical protein ABR545_04265, partial [Cyclonatronaceae bacterium]
QQTLVISHQSSVISHQSSDSEFNLILCVFIVPGGFLKSPHVLRLRSAALSTTFFCAHHDVFLRAA